MILGAIVIIVVGMLVVNYFRSSEPGETFPEGITTEEEITLPTNHLVEAGETLWSISEKYYKSGYNWVDIAEANSLSRSDIISEGQEIIIPDVEPRILDEEGALAQNDETTETMAPEPTQAPTVSPTVSPTQTPEAEIDEQKQPVQDVEGDSYTVVKGDSLWKIAERAYGDGYKWVEIARANNLINPDLIHAGNVFVIPR